MLKSFEKTQAFTLSDFVLTATLKDGKLYGMQQARSMKKAILDNSTGGNVLDLVAHLKAIDPKYQAELMAALKACRHEVDIEKVVKKFEARK